MHITPPMDKNTQEQINKLLKEVIDHGFGKVEIFINNAHVDHVNILKTNKIINASISLQE